MQEDTSQDKEKEAINLKALSLVGHILENRYRIEEIIGEGAMGYVYKGTQLRLKRTVAIKIPRYELSQDPHFMSRFEREALSMARCIHENIVTIYDVYVAKNPEEISYIAMEFITGSNLHQFLRAEEANLTIRAIMEILKQLARGIDAAHAAGVIHRDIKPANMIVTLPQRMAKIMDFGIAKTDYDDIFKTQVGFSMGTPAFMAPEQIRGEKLGPPADIYSFAMSLYKIFARNLPFDATTSGELLACHLNESPILLRKKNPAWPIELERILAVSISKNPDDRHATASQLVEEIERALQPFYGRSFAEFFSASSIPHSGNLQKSFSIPKRLIPTIIIPFLILFSGFSFLWIIRGKKEKSPSSNSMGIPLSPVQNITSSSSASGAPKESLLPQSKTHSELSHQDFQLESKLIDDIVLNGIRLPIFRNRLDDARKTMEHIDLDTLNSFLNVINYYGEEYKDLTLLYVPGERSIDKDKARIRFRTGLTGKKRSEGNGSKQVVLVPSFEATAGFVKKDKEWILTEWSSFDPFLKHIKKGE